MNADFNNMQLGDYVMIASTVEVEDNAKLYTRGESQWIFISDFSGAQGIKGETGATPNIQIGTVTSGSTPSVTRSGTDENPVLNFVLEKGEKGDTGDTGATGATGNGIASVTKTGTSGLVDTYTITFTDGTTTTFDITNGEDGEVTQEQLNEVKRKVDKTSSFLADATPITDTTIHTTDSADWYGDLNPEGFSRQNTRSGKNKFNKNSTGRLNKVATTVLDTGVKVVIAQTGSYCSVSYAIIDIREHYGSTVRIKTTMSASANNVAKLAYGYCNSSGENMGSQTTSSTGELEVVLPNSVTEGREYLGLILYANYNGTSAVDDYAEFKDLIVTIDNADMTYEEYGVSPSPDFPSEIRNLESNGNLALNDNPENPDVNYYGGSGSSAVQYSTTEKGYYTSTNRSRIVKLDKTGTFTFSLDVKLRSDGTSTNVGILYHYNTKTGEESSIGYISAVANLTSNYARYTKTFTNSEDYDAIRIVFYNHLYWKDIQVVEGTKPYAPYDSLRFKQVGKNLVDISETTSTGATVTALEEFTNFVVGTTYTLSAKLDLGDTAKSGRIRVALVYNDGTPISYAGDYVSGTGVKISTATVTITSNIQRVVIAFQPNSAGIRLYDIQLEVGSATDYEPYKEHNIDFPLNGQKMYEGSTLTDEGITHIRKKILFDGTEEFTTNTASGMKRFIFPLPEIASGGENRGVALCNYYAYGYNYVQDYCYIDSTKLNFYFNDNNYAGLTSWKTHLASLYANGTPLILEYELAIPEIIPYTEAQQTAYNELQNIDTYQYVNNIELISNEETNMTFNYKQDLQMQISQIANP